MNRYIITISGLGDATLEAPTAGKARYQVWLNARDAGYFRGMAFRDFLGRCYTLHLGPVPAALTAMKGNGDA